MHQKLHNLFSNLAIAASERELRSRFMDSAGDIFDAKAWGWKFLDNNYQIIDCELRGLSDRIVNQYQQIGYRNDPLMNYAIEHHAPVHESVIFTSAIWQHTNIYQQVFSRYEIEHLAIAPLVGNGRILGKVFLTRGKDSQAFTRTDLDRLSALSAHLSVCLATMQWRSRSSESSFSHYLTKRERQIADLVAQGLKTAELSLELGITQNSVKGALKRIFLKLNVSTRAEMVAKLRTVFN
ncbi:MAG: LuxR C-terminal-related transcriptional regulator [Xenococcaceae cyanobacterium]